MLLLPLALSLVPAAATAKLWGWPDSFSVSADVFGDNISDPNWMRVCSGWGNWCHDDCQSIQHFDHRLAVGGSYLHPEVWTWAQIQKENSAWVDFWRQGNSDTFNMYESNKDGTVHGQCQIVHFHEEPQHCLGRKVMVLLNCWQW